MPAAARAGAARPRPRAPLRAPRRARRADRPRRRRAALAPIEANICSCVKRSSASHGGAPEHALVADPAREPVRVEAFEEKLRRLAADAEEIAEAPERDSPRL